MKKSSPSVKPIVLIILDGWGVAPKGRGNSISLAKTPMIDYLYENYPNSTLAAAGEAVGLLKRQAGNSEAGHMNIGAGRVVLQDISDINQQIDNGKFFLNPSLLEIVQYKKAHPHAKIHAMGLLTAEQSAHSHPHHLYALLEFFKRHNLNDIYIHLFSDGRDSGRYEGVRLVEKLMRNLKNGEVIASVIGRYYAMDRAQNWKRTKLAYELLVEGKGISVDNPIKAFTEMYDRGFTDEFLPPIVVNNPKKPPVFIDSDDVVVFFNCRSDRARQLAKPFVQPKFEKMGGFRRKKVLNKIFMISFTDFGENLDHILNAFPHAILENTLTCALAAGGLSQMYMAETEKYAHVTYFLNGGSDKPRCGESRLKIPSAKVSSFVLKPAMSTPIIARKIIDFVKRGTYDFYCANFANADMLAHSGNFAATVLGVEAVDRALKEIYRAVVHRGGTIIITGDHGNAEVMFDEEGLAETKHNLNPVPFFLINKSTKGKFTMLNKRGKLSQVAPTMLEFAGVKKPKEMTGRSLLNDK